MAAVQPAATPLADRSHEPLACRYTRIREASLAICSPLEVEDYVVQSMPDASPAKWHLAHTSWFFEQFLLRPLLSGYQPFQAGFEFLFNSYYQAVGPMHQRPERGLLTRPTVKEVFAYRKHVDDHILKLLDSRDEDDDQLNPLVQLGLNHEQQHQELMFTDLKHLLSRNPLLPAYSRKPQPATEVRASGQMQFLTFEGGVREIGATGKHFCFDNETPRHRTLVEPYALGDRLVTNGEYLEFMRDGGYRRAEFWLSDGWSTVTQEGWSRPFYWTPALDAEFTLRGLQSLDTAAPVCHLSYYEADAFARWAGARLPTEAEWELAAESLPVRGNLLKTDMLKPLPAGDQPGLKQMFGDVWEWTASPYSAYPGYRPLSGALGEYNGKFMCSQVVLRGGSCVTPADHVRATYRNFFYPQARWQFMGVRLARDL
ncbi:ergothioneine biosynthesis protein EgtB [Steroidobacter sp.]|uniref:ergothioneine biosynthesis protein EgtB n=1 Tax=Steroidobacter sp. TaxID=1978227 RepID=UPI001A36E4D3|nr:ergothioneine biosynthesis protein EgtB [Steroidobacter sp.]MBL8269303.1 ergothioneine biosynthesis protein EgtB [Steroidobacter sp.]